VKFSASPSFDPSGVVAPGATATVVAFVGVEVPVAAISLDSGAITGTTVNAGVADEEMSPGDTGANAVVFVGLKFVLGIFEVVSLDDGKPPEAAVDVVFAGLGFVLGALGVISLDDGKPPEAAVDVVFAGLGFALGPFGVISLDGGEPSEAAVDAVVGLVTRVTLPSADGVAGGSVVEVVVRGGSADGEGDSVDSTAAEIAAEVAAVRASSKGSFGAS
jgi:hypothetical protein